RAGLEKLVELGLRLALEIVEVHGDQSSLRYSIRARLSSSGSSLPNSCPRSVIRSGLLLAANNAGATSRFISSRAAWESRLRSLISASARLIRRKIPASFFTSESGFRLASRLTGVPAGMG